MGDEQKSCPVCCGAGWWEDPIACQSVRCYLCRPATEDRVDVCDGKWIPEWPRHDCKYHGPAFHAPPWLLVIHAGSTGGDIARFFSETGYVQKADGRKILVSAHINWDAEAGSYSQGVPLSHVAWHCGGSTIEAAKLRAKWDRAPVSGTIRKLNFVSLGIEMRGPSGRKFSVGEHHDLQRRVERIIKVVPSLKVVTKHQTICDSRRDPGPWLELDCLEPLGLIVYR